MISNDKFMLIFICVSFLFVAIFVILCYLIERHRTNKFNKDLAKICKDHIPPQQDDISSILLFRKELQKDIRMCEDTAEKLKMILKDIDEKILNPKYYGINNEDDD